MPPVPAPRPLAWPSDRNCQRHLNHRQRLPLPQPDRHQRYRRPEAEISNLAMVQWSAGYRWWYHPAPEPNHQRYRQGIAVSGTDKQSGPVHSGRVHSVQLAAAVAGFDPTGLVPQYPVERLSVPRCITRKCIARPSFHLFLLLAACRAC